MTIDWVPMDFTLSERHFRLDQREKTSVQSMTVRPANDKVLTLRHTLAPGFPTYLVWKDLLDAS
jgi:hypothetical protein